MVGPEVDGSDEDLQVGRAGGRQHAHQGDDAALVTGPGRQAHQQAPADQLVAEVLRGISTREWAEHPDLDREADPPAAGRPEEVAVPTVVVDALLDVPEIRAVAALVLSGVPGARRVEVDGAARLAPLEHPEQVTAAITGLLEEMGW